MELDQKMCEGSFPSIMNLGKIHIPISPVFFSISLVFYIIFHQWPGSIFSSGYKLTLFAFLIKLDTVDMLLYCDVEKV